MEVTKKLQKRYLVGFPGKIINVSRQGDYMTKNEKPSTVENLMPPVIAHEIIRNVHPKNVQAMVRNIRKNRRISYGIGNGKVDKIAIGKKYLEKVNKLLESDQNNPGDLNTIESLYKEAFKGSIGKFFNKLYNKISEANGYTASHLKRQV